MEQQRLFWDKCLAKNITSFEIKSMKECNKVLENYPVYFDADTITRILREAVDVIAAYSTRNPAWKKIMQEEGSIAPSPPPWITDETKK